MPKKILIIDDEEQVIKSIKRLFHTEKDIEIYSICNPEELDKVLNEHFFDVVLVDVMMPGIDGFEVVRRLKTKHAEKDIRILTISGNYPDSGKLILESMGAFKCLDKPYEPEEFKEEIKNILNGYIN